MKIALLGAPGAGKSKLARALVRNFNRKGIYSEPPAPRPGSQWHIVDGYVEKLQKQTGGSYGPSTSFPAELEILGARWAAEDAGVSQEKHVITCGTIYESIIYASSIQPWQLNEQTLLEDQVYIASVMGALGALATKTVDYIGLFYLPWDSGDEHSWNAVVNAKIPEVLQGFGVPYVTLTGTHKQKVQRVTELIAPFIAPPTEDEQQAV